MKEQITTQELCRRSGVPRDSLNRIVKRLELKPCGQVMGKTRTMVWLWPASYVETLVLARKFGRQPKGKRKAKRAK